MVDRSIALPPYPVEGRIPNFKGALEASNNLVRLPAYIRARKVLVAPDSPLKYLRIKVARDGKTLVMATPRLRRGYAFLTRNLKTYNGTIKATMMNSTFKDNPGAVDLVVEGCVAVDKDGWRLGKGGGYGDREIRLARTLNPKVVVAVICHSFQVVDEVPHEDYDQRVDLICTERFCFHVTAYLNKA